MMEKATVRECLSVTLTYANDTEAQRKGARQFVYSQVQQFLRNLRDLVDAKLGYEGGLRYLVGGEVGDLRGRVHWHILLFSEAVLTEIGEWRCPWGVETNRKYLVSVHGEKVKPCHWSEWPHGTVTAQDPDAGGMRYAMAYALKDQFGLVESEGTARVGKAEFEAAGWFRQSRRVPIGVRFVLNRLALLEERRAVDPVARLAVPGMNWPWNLSGLCRRVALEGYARINSMVRADTGLDAAAWSSLVASCEKSPKSLAALGVQEVEAVWDETDDRRIVSSGRQAKGYADIGRIVRRCGSSVACSHCLRGQSDQQLASKGMMVLPDGAFVYIGQWFAAGGQDYDSWQDAADPEMRKQLGHCVDVVRKAQIDVAAGGINPECMMRGTASHKLAFPSSGVDTVPLLGAASYPRRFSGK